MTITVTTNVECKLHHVRVRGNKSCRNNFELRIAAFPSAHHFEFSRIKNSSLAGANSLIRWLVNSARMIPLNRSVIILSISCFSLILIGLFSFNRSTIRDIRSRIYATETMVTHAISFDSIYVLSLPSRQDRRQAIKSLVDMLNLDVTFIDALDRSEPVIQWIAEQVLQVRDRKREILASPDVVEITSC
jgi:hypothetical protein